jgi:DNA-directed RNA polymerase subunit RPC12/RpoP
MGTSPANNRNRLLQKTKVDSMKQHWKWNRKKGWVPRNTPYNNHYYCAKCRRWIPKTEAEKSPKRMLRCPSCGRKLRTKARIYGKRKPKTSNLATTLHLFKRYL